MKYIVYLTTNLVNNKIYIGVHKTMDPYHFDGYLGNGVIANYKHTYIGNHTPFECAVHKYGPDKFQRKTLKVFDTLEDALDLERWLVDPEFIKRKDTYNVALGGGLPPIVNAKTIYQYSLEGEFIKEWPSIAEAAQYYKCSSTGIGKAVDNRTPSMKFLWTEAKYDSLDVSTFHIDENKIKTYLYDIDGNFFEEFDSRSECAKFIDATGDQVTMAIKGKYSINGEWYCSNSKLAKFIPLEKEQHKGQPLYQYDLSGKFVKEWTSYAEVKAFYGKDISIHASIRMGRQCQGYQWSWEKVPCMKEFVKYNKQRKIGQFTKDGELVATFNSTREAQKIACGAPQVLSGKRKTAGGYVWKYIED